MCVSFPLRRGVTSSPTSFPFVVLAQESISFVEEFEVGDDNRYGKSYCQYATHCTDAADDFPYQRLGYLQKHKYLELPRKDRTDRIE